MSQDNGNGQKVTLTMMGNGRIRVDYGDQSGGRWVVVPYSDIKDYVLSLKPRLELVELYGLAD
jgi:hypothetical protein